MLADKSFCFTVEHFFVNVTCGPVSAVGIERVLDRRIVYDVFVFFALCAEACVEIIGRLLGRKQGNVIGELGIAAEQQTLDRYRIFRVEVEAELTGVDTSLHFHPANVQVLPRLPAEWCWHCSAAEIRDKPFPCMPI